MSRNSYGYIYKTTNLINHKIYIGKKHGSFNPNYFGSGVLIKKALLKYGTDNFEVELLMHCNSEKELNHQEIIFIANYRSLFPLNEMYNIHAGGQGGDNFSNNPNMDLIIQKLKDSHKGQYQPKKRREERECLCGCREKFIVKFDSTKKFVSGHNSCIKKPYSGKKEKGSGRRSYAGDGNPFYGKKHNIETIKKIIDSRKSLKLPAWNKDKKGVQKHSEETKQKMRMSRFNYLKRRDNLCQMLNQ